MKLTPEQWREVLARPETQEAIRQFAVAYHRRVNERLLKDLHTPWWLAAIGWTALVTVPVSVVYLIQRGLL